MFVDGHEDASLPAQSSTGEAADMELAFALGMAERSWSQEFAAVCPHLEATDVRVLGPRDAGTLRDEGVASLRDRLSFVSGPDLTGDPGGQTQAAVSSLTHPWWFHLDLDVLSTEALPAIDYPQNGGLAWEDLSEVTAQALGAEPAGWDITIYNPDLDPARTSARRIVEFVSSAIRGRPASARW
jgi:arginase